MGQEIPDYLVFIHRIFLPDGQVKLGGLDQILTYLQKKGKKMLYFEHPLNPHDHPFSYVKLNQQVLSKKEIRPRKPPLRWLGEVWSDIRFVQKEIRQPLIALTADPLASLSALVLKKLGRIKHYYFHSIDYSENRFGNLILNKIYQRLFFLTVNGAAKVGVVSPRIKEKLVASGVDEKKVIFVPNSPSLEVIGPFQKEIGERKIWQLVITCAGIEPKFRLEDILQVFSLLKPKFPQAKLVIIGPTTTDPIYFEKLVAIVKRNAWENEITFTGFLPKEKNWEIIGQSGVGLAFYDSSHSHVNFGDSLKIREYAALGLPIVADKVTFT
ncbi:MAG: glycosyltransferase, partial [bacterium]|nr:glycosyltransferase [bacterium]